VIDPDQERGSWQSFIQVRETRVVLFHRAKQYNIKDLKDVSRIRGKRDDSDSGTDDKRNNLICDVR
jgi:hypothetical protein